MKRSMRASIALLAAVPFMMVLGNSMLFPVFPRMQAALHLTGLQTSLVVTAFSVPAGILIPFAGYLSDRHGRKPIMAPALVIFGIGALIAGLSVSLLGTYAYPGLLAGRVIQGMGAAGMAQLAMALTADIFRSAERAQVLGWLEAANGLGKVISPIAGAAVGLVLWLLPFYIFAALSIPLGIALWLWVREPAAKRPQKAFTAYFGGVRAVFARKGLALSVLLLSGAVVMFVLFGTLFYLSEVLEKRYGMAELTSGFILALPVAALSATSLLTGGYLRRRAPLAKTVIVAGLSVVAAVMVVNALFTDRWILFSAIFFMGIGGGFVLPTLTLLITSSTALSERGMVTSLYGGVRFFGVALGPPTFGWLMHMGSAPLFWAAAGMIGLTILLNLLLLNPLAMLQGSGQSGDEKRERYVIAFRPPPRPHPSR
jgi:ACDE family multidrug resistance protein